ncbi:hypothetical protein Q1W73_08855 [Asticcacaulis sp. ZE23SCel15]|uniref:hypothetical protein n=1 Tax=Asticcacaulis sp. ZE23SCel15 TaxID=3059027 RepID=UPI00265DC85C|nr:hypothetical protein [Asticcacaulis sp. ZE23SCel15]WKL55816.1 hypothetical protein Q1W73_08855 [Asticcacaulis sp. ZE23SCel15]
MTFKALNRTAFEDALKKGMGKALRHVEACSDDGVEDIILKGCLENPVFDRQCNGGRGKWMMAVLSHARNPQVYYDEIIGALAAAEDDDAAHLADLCLELALGGNIAAKNALYAKFVSDIENYQYLSHHIVDLNGVEGLIFSASHIGHYLAENPEYREDNWFLSHYADKLGKDNVTKAFDQAAQTDRGVHAYIDRVMRTDGYLLMSDEPEQKRRTFRPKTIFSSYKVIRSKRSLVVPVLAAGHLMRTSKNCLRP